MTQELPGKLFSEIASDYDKSFSDKPYVQELRRRIYKLALDYYSAHANILELGCGTGIDAVHLAQRGFNITATDPSMGMLLAAATWRKKTNTDFTLLRLKAEQLSSIRDRSFQGIFSNFGALNCVRDLERVFNESHRILQDNGIFILNLINRFSVVESLAYLRHGKAKQAFRRWNRGGVSVPLGSGSVLTWYHSFASIKKMIKGKFTVQKVIGLNILTPTPQFESAYEKHPRLVQIADSIERVIDSLPVFSTLGDHFVIVLERFE